MASPEQTKEPILPKNVESPADGAMIINPDTGSVRFGGKVPDSFREKLIAAIKPKE